MSVLIRVSYCSRQIVILLPLPMLIKQFALEGGIIVVKQNSKHENISCRVIRSDVEEPSEDQVQLQHFMTRSSRIQRIRNACQFFLTSPKSTPQECGTERYAICITIAKPTELHIASSHWVQCSLTSLCRTRDYLYSNFCFVFCVFGIRFPTLWFLL